VEQTAFKSELDLPNCTANQAMAIVDIKEAGGSYHYFGKAGWLPPSGESLSKAARKHFRHTDRTIRSLIRSGWLSVTQEHRGQPVRVTLTFP
jgi:hypothetical protein